MLCGEIEGACDYIALMPTKIASIQKPVFRQVGDVFSWSRTEREDECAMACQNGLFYVTITDNEIKPCGTEYALLNRQVLQVEHVGGGKFVVITSSVGLTETHETVEYVIFQRKPNANADLKTLITVRTSVHQRTSYLLKVLAGSDERFLFTIIAPWLKLIDTARKRVFNIAEIQDFDQMSHYAFSIEQRADKSFFLLILVKNSESWGVRTVQLKPTLVAQIIAWLTHEKPKRYLHED